VRKLAEAIGIAYGLFVWSVAEGFGGPYVLSTTTDLGAAIIYSLVFWARSRERRRGASGRLRP